MTSSSVRCKGKAASLSRSCGLVVSTHFSQLNQGYWAVASTMELQADGWRCDDGQSEVAGDGSLGWGRVEEVMFGVRPVG